MQIITITSSECFYFCLFELLCFYFKIENIYLMDLMHKQILNFFSRHGSSSHPFMDSSKSPLNDPGSPSRAGRSEQSSGASVMSGASNISGNSRFSNAVQGIRNAIRSSFHTSAGKANGPLHGQQVAGRTGSGSGDSSSRGSEDPFNGHAGGVEDNQVGVSVGSIAT
jgi:hypothetical protein